MRSEVGGEVGGQRSGGPGAPGGPIVKLAFCVLERIYKQG